MASCSKEEARAFVASHPEFALEEPPKPFNEGLVTQPVTYWPNGFVRRLPEPPP